MIILSLTRSNSSRVVGFLSETRRINVSITRAKKLCVVIGDSGTLSSDLGLRSFYNYCLENKAVIPVESFMSSSASYDSDGDS